MSQFAPNQITIPGFHHPGQLSQRSNWLVSRRLVIYFRQGQGIPSSVFITSRPVVRPTQSLSNGYRGVQQPGCEADRSPPLSADVKKAWSFTSTLLHLYLFKEWYLIKHRDNFTLSFLNSPVDTEKNHKSLSRQQLKQSTFEQGTTRIRVKRTIPTQPCPVTPKPCEVQICHVQQSLF